VDKLHLRFHRKSEFSYNFFCCYFWFWLEVLNGVSMRCNETKKDK